MTTRHPGYDCPAHGQSGKCPVKGCPYGKGHYGPRSKDGKHQEMRRAPRAEQPIIFDATYEPVEAPEPLGER